MCCIAETLTLTTGDITRFCLSRQERLKKLCKKPLAFKILKDFLWRQQTAGCTLKITARCLWDLVTLLTDTDQAHLDKVNRVILRYGTITRSKRFDPLMREVKKALKPKPANTSAREHRKQYTGAARIPYKPTHGRAVIHFGGRSSF